MSTGLEAGLSVAGKSIVERRAGQDYGFLSGRCWPGFYPAVWADDGFHGGPGAAGVSRVFSSRAWPRVDFSMVSRGFQGFSGVFWHGDGGFRGFGVFWIFGGEQRNVVFMVVFFCFQDMGLIVFSDGFGLKNKACVMGFVGDSLFIIFHIFHCS